MTSLASLLSDIERATEGSPALEMRVADEVLSSVGVSHLAGDLSGTHDVPLYRYPDGTIGLALRYTRSLDAAVTLVGKVDGSQLSVRLSAWDGGKLGAHAWLFGPSGRYMSDVKCWGEAHIGWPGCKTIERAHSLFPLALCAACLRARMATAQNEKPPNPHEGSPAA